MHLKPPDECEEWIAHFEQDEHKNLRWIARLNLRNARLCAEAQVLFDSPTQDDDWVLQLLQVCTSEQ
jgi:hypothetical protein